MSDSITSQQKHYQANRERLLKEQKEYYQANKVEINRKRKEYYQANKEREIKTSLEWRANNKEKSMKKQSEYYQANKEDILKRAKVHYQKRKSYILAKKYGLTEEEYLQMFIDRNHQCDMCGMKSKGKKLAVDHNHITGQVRGLLCQRCNTGIGALRTDESLDIIKKAIEYLENNNE